MSLSATGVLSTALENLRTLLANCATWKTWTGSPTVAAAKESIHVGEYQAPEENAGPFTKQDLEENRPFAVIGFPDKNPWGSRRVATDQTFRRNGRMGVLIQADVPESYRENPTEAQVDFLNKLGAVLEEMENLSGTAGFLIILGISIDEFARSDEDEDSSAGDYFTANLLIECDFL